MRVISSANLEYVDIPYEHYTLEIIPRNTRNSHLGGGDIIDSYYIISATSVHDKNNSRVIGKYGEEVTAHNVVKMITENYHNGCKVFRLPDRFDKMM